MNEVLAALAWKDEAERLRKLIREAVYDATLATHAGDMDEVRRILNKLRDEADK